MSLFLLYRLVCAVSYTTLSGEKMYFRKFFKFQVTFYTLLKSQEFCFLCTVINNLSAKALTQNGNAFNGAHKTLNGFLDKPSFLKGCISMLTKK